MIRDRLRHWAIEVLTRKLNRVSMEVFKARLSGDERKLEYLLEKQRDVTRLLERLSWGK